MRRSWSHLISLIATRLLYASENTHYRNGNCSKFVVRENLFSWRGILSFMFLNVHRYIPCRQHLFLLLYTFFFDAVPSYLKASLGSLSTASDHCFNNNDCLPAHKDGCWCDPCKLLHERFILCIDYIIFWWNPRVAYDCIPTCSFLQAERVMLLPCLGLCCSHSYP